MIGFIQAINQSSLGWLQGNVEGKLPQTTVHEWEELHNLTVLLDCLWHLRVTRTVHQWLPHLPIKSPNIFSHHTTIKVQKQLPLFMTLSVKSNRNLSHLWRCNQNQFKQTFRTKMEKLTSVFPDEIFPAGLMSIVLFLHLESLPTWSHSNPTS
jgi:hypothetical protein